MDTICHKQLLEFSALYPPLSFWRFRSTSKLCLALSNLLPQAPVTTPSVCGTSPPSSASPRSPVTRTTWWRWPLALAASCSARPPTTPYGKRRRGPALSTNWSWALESTRVLCCCSEVRRIELLLHSTHLGLYPLPPYHHTGAPFKALLVFSSLASPCFMPRSMWSLLTYDCLCVFLQEGSCFLSLACTPRGVLSGSRWGPGGHVLEQLYIALRHFSCPLTSGRQWRLSRWKGRGSLACGREYVSVLFPSTFSCASSVLLPVPCGLVMAWCATGSPMRRCCPICTSSTSSRWRTATTIASTSTRTTIISEARTQ